MNSGSCAGVDYVIVDANAMLSVMKHYVMILCIRENCFVSKKIFLLFGSLTKLIIALFNQKM